VIQQLVDEASRQQRKGRAASEADRAFAEEVYFSTQRWLIEELFGWRGDEVERAKFAEFYDQQHASIISVKGQDIGWVTERERT
jgi:hypothetical protein